ncbi:MAG: 4-alpha-glucanotransferase [Prevotella sp.]|nr:4-alpha-glucanotransferase [Prevotella sp.]
MKLKFSIHYNTEWGQSIHVFIRYRTNDGREHVNNWLMQTQDGVWWYLETALMESRQRMVTSFTYEYLLKNQEGRVLRREWNRLPRTYHADATKSFVFPDQWRDVPLHAYLYSKARNVGREEPADTTQNALSLPLFRKTIIFSVAAPQLRQGEYVALVGSHPAIGSWNPTRYLRMTYQGGFIWRLSVNMVGIQLPLEYKYVVIDGKTNQLRDWEGGENRTIQYEEVNDGEVLVLDGGSLHLKEDNWQIAGVAVPIFSLRSKHSYGVGDFGDLQRMVDWVAMTGMKMIQLLPLNDTTNIQSWDDPYTIVSCFALHPHYLDLDQLGELKDRKKMKMYLRQRRELNSLTNSDYTTVDRVKNAYINDIFEEKGEETLQSDDYQSFWESNKSWLLPYAVFCCLRDEYHTSHYSDWKAYATYQLSNIEMLRQEPSPYYNIIQRICFVQYHLYLQLKRVVNYAHSKGVSLKGDLPLGICRDSVETWMNPQLSQLGARWDEKSGIYDWWRQYLQWMEQFFDAVRINHLVNFFRTWVIPEDVAVTRKLKTMMNDTTMLICDEDPDIQSVRGRKVVDELQAPSRLCILDIHDWLSMNRSLQSEQFTIEDLLKAKRFNTKIRNMIIRSKR